MKQCSLCAFYEGYSALCNHNVQMYPLNYGKISVVPFAILIFTLCLQNSGENTGLKYIQSVKQSFPSGKILLYESSLMWYRPHPPLHNIEETLAQGSNLRLLHSQTYTGILLPLVNECLKHLNGTG